MSTPTHPTAPPMLQFAAMVFVAVATLVPASWVVWKAHRRIWFEPVTVEKSEFVVRVYRGQRGSGASIEGTFTYVLSGQTRMSSRFSDFGSFVSKRDAERALAEVARTSPSTAYRAPWSETAIRSNLFWRHDSLFMGMATCFASFGVAFLMMIIDRALAEFHGLTSDSVRRASGATDGGAAGEGGDRATWPESPFVLPTWIVAFFGLFPFGFVIMMVSFLSGHSRAPEVLMAVHRVVVVVTLVAMAGAVVQGVVKARRLSRRRIETRGRV